MKARIVLVSLMLALGFLGFQVEAADYTENSKTTLYFILGFFATTAVTTLFMVGTSVDDDGFIWSGSPLYRFMNWMNPQSIHDGKVRLCPTYWLNAMALVGLLVIGALVGCFVSQANIALFGNEEHEVWAARVSISLVASLALGIVLLRTFKKTAVKVCMVAALAGFGYLNYLVYCQNLAQGFTPAGAIWKLICDAGEPTCMLVAGMSAFCFMLVFFAKFVDPYIEPVTKWVHDSLPAQLVRSVIDGTCVTFYLKDPAIK